MSYPDTPYTLPTLHFVGGETQDLVFHVYFYANHNAMSMSSCVCNFSVINFLNRSGFPVLSKQMEILTDQEAAIDNILSVCLSAFDTAELHGKYIYQITIRDVDGNVEIPNQGLLYITKNINQGFITSP